MQVLYLLRLRFVMSIALSRRFEFETRAVFITLSNSRQRKKLASPRSPFQFVARFKKGLCLERRASGAHKDALFDCSTDVAEQTKVFATVPQRQ